MTGHTSLILRTCAHDMTAHGGFAWPTEGPVAAPDWDPAPNRGNGLHGLLWGEGDGQLLDWSADACWLVVEVPTDAIIDLGGKVKFPAGTVVHCGDQHSATRFLAVHPEAQHRAIVGGTATAGDWGTATAGYRATATAGDGGTATAGDHGTAAAGYRGTATAGYRGTATAGDWGTATAGDRGTATAGHWGTATAGNRGTATAGYRGTATAGYRGTATAGYRGTLLIRWHDGQRYRIAVGYIGENDLKADTPYQVDKTGRFAEVQP